MIKNGLVEVRQLVVVSNHKFNKDYLIKLNIVSTFECDKKLTNV